MQTLEQGHIVALRQNDVRRMSLSVGFQPYRKGLRVLEGECKAFWTLLMFLMFFPFNMTTLGLLVAGAALTSALPSSPPSYLSPVMVSQSPSKGAGIPLQPFVSYSIEFSSFPDFAGNLSSPNTFSNNLLNNLGHFTGIKPYIRVGGNTQDYAVFNKSLDTALVGIVDPAKSPDYPTTITIGPKYFESYLTWPDTHFIHGFDLGRNSSIARQGLIDSVAYACKALRGKLAYWELGNEPDLYKTSAQGPVRPSTWHEQDYANEWLHWTRALKVALAKACPDLATDAKYKYYSPSFAGTGGNSLDPITTWEDGLDTYKDIAIISSHK